MSRHFDLPGRSPVYATNAMAATSHPMATTTALNTLRKGGSAVDAAIAASATLCIVEPHMTGIGGDCFAFVGKPCGQVYALNGSGKAAKKARLDWYLERGFDQIPVTSPHAVTVPGALRGWQALHQRFGKLDWKQLFTDAIHYGKEGFVIAPRIAHDWQKLVEKLNGNEAAKTHLLFDGCAPEVGQKIRLPALAETLETIAKHGPNRFYQGEIAAEIISTLKSLGGFLTEQDMALCEADWVEPIKTRYNGFEVLQVPPNGQGITALIMLNLLSASQGSPPPLSSERFHQSIEFGRLAYSIRDAFIADPHTMQTPVSDLLSDKTTSLLHAQFDPGQRNNSLCLPRLPQASTIYLSVVDQDAMAVSFINSVYSGFGTGIVTPKSGIALQNRGSCFAIEENHPNAIGPCKRPLHTIIPGMVLEKGLPVFSFGVMGGAYQPMGQAHVLQNMIEYKMDPQEALDFPRLFWNEMDELVGERGLPGSVLEGLTKRGHKLIGGGLHGGGQIISIDRKNGVLIGASDPRKDGHAAGF